MAFARDRVSRNPTAIALATVGGLLTFSVGVAFVVLPLAQAPNAGLTPWTAICRAVGILPGTPAQRQPPSSATAAPVSHVTWTPRTLAILAGADARPGAQLAAAVCVNCHGDQGLSLTSDYPQLAGQSATAIYKQLSDFRSGARYSQVMSPVAQQLAPDQLAQVAAYFASYGEPDTLGNRFMGADPAIARLARRGDPQRGLPPCESCHGAHSGGPIEAPVLTGQWAGYLERQLTAYAGAQRSNDVYRRMRDIAAKLTPDERHRLAAYYQGTR
jgi:cytochrome c553